MRLSERFKQYAENSTEIHARYAEESVLTVFANEPVWLLVNSFLALFLEPESIIRAIVFVSAALFAYAFTRTDPRNCVWLI